MTELRATGPLLWARAALLGCVGLLTGVVSHTAADGLLPSVGWMLALAAWSIVVSAWFLRRRRTAPLLVALALAAQACVHLALSILAGHRGEARVSPTLAPASSGSLEDALMGGHVDPATQVDLGWTTHALDHLTAVGPWMVLGHLAGAAALGAWLAVGEAALWGLLLFVGASVLARLSLRLPPVVRRPRPLPIAVGQATPVSLLVVGSRSRRGPPVPVC